MAAVAGLTTDPSVVTCIANDYSYDEVFARQVDALVSPADMVMAFTTSGRSPNVVGGLAAARRHGAVTVLCGAGDGGPAVLNATHRLLVPVERTARAQEMHLLVLHLISEIVDAWAAATEITGTGTTGTETTGTETTATDVADTGRRPTPGPPTTGGDP